MDAPPPPRGCATSLKRTDPKLFADLDPRWAELLRKAELFPGHSSYPGDPPERGVTVTQDGMLYDARSRPSCELATDECYRSLLKDGALPGVEPSSPRPPAPTGLEESPPTPGRPCRAREHGREGCFCGTAACQQRCRRASALDPEARFIHYQGHNGKHREAGQDEGNGGKGKNVFGYRSIAERVLDDRWAVAWIVSSGLYSATTDECTVFVPRLQYLTARPARDEDRGVAG